MSNPISESSKFHKNVVQKKLNQLGPINTTQLGTIGPQKLGCFRLPFSFWMIFLQCVMQGRYESMNEPEQNQSVL